MVEATFGKKVLDELIENTLTLSNLGLFRKYITN